MSTTKVEFAVQMTCDSCVNAVKKSLENVPGIKNFDINLEKNSVVIDSSLPTLELKSVLEKSGRKVAIKGHAGSLAAVSILACGEPNIKGVVRFVQIDPKTCIIDGTVDGLTPGEHTISVHETGDISEGCKSIGDIFNPSNNYNNRLFGDLGTVKAGPDGRASFRKEDNVLKLSEVIGRSFMISSSDKKQNSCGVIARSAGLFENPKQICACDGVSIWDETNIKK